MTKRAIPLVDLQKFTQGDQVSRQEFATAIGTAFKEIGFVGVINHGIPKELIDRFYQVAKAFFALPDETKRKYEIEALAGQRGYTSFGKEHAKQSEYADLKEFFQIGQEVEGGNLEEYPTNINVKEVENFTSTGMELYKSFEKAGGALLKAIAIFLGLDEHYFESHIKDGNSILRAIHYPPITREPASAIRAEQHEDINLITLLVGASAGGLEILDANQKWLPIIPENDEIVINVGDMLQRLTNNYLKSTTHRVVNPPKTEWHLPRLSIPFFLHPKSNMDLTCLPQCVDENRPTAYPPIDAGTYLWERLKEIGLTK
jgi:isopenicillin N synthase-like dioxygenase